MARGRRRDPSVRFVYERAASVSRLSFGGALVKPIATSIAAIGAAFLLAASAFAAAPTAADLTRAPAIESVSLSPDGKHLAALASPDGQVVDVVVWRTDALRAPPERIRATHMRFTGVKFLKNDRLLVDAVQPVTMDAASINLRQEYITDLEGKSFSPLLPGEDVSHPQFSRLVSTLPMDLRNVLVEAPSGDIYSVDVYRLSAAHMMNGSDKFFDYRVDLKGALRAREYADFEGGKVFIAQQFRDPDSGQWVELFRSYAKDRTPTNIVGFTTDPHVILIASPQGGDKTGIYEYDVKTRKIIEQAFEHRLFEAAGAVVQSRAPKDFGRLLGFIYEAETSKIYWLDPAFEAMQKQVEHALGVTTTAVDWTDPGSGLKATVPVESGASVDLIGWSDDQQTFIFQKSGPKQPPEYYLLAGGKLSLLGKARPWIDLSTIGDTKLVEYPARDGLLIPAFVTLPPAAQFGPGPYPTLVEPHGGPWARDDMEWDPAGWVQYFVSRGYAVIEPQFRGSEGWGQKLWRAGDREWGQTMADDLDDAVKWLIDQHVADPKRVAMFGYSYGGYAALAASIRPNGLYQCAISGGGAPDLERFASDTYDSRWEREYQHPTVAGLNALTHAKDAQIPVLLYMGDRDQTVDPEQSRKFAAALRGAGKPVKLVEIKDMGHQYDLMTPAMLKEQLDIIDAYLKTDCKPGGL
jgi:acetyl esterase/lipase